MLKHVLVRLSAMQLRRAVKTAVAGFTLKVQHARPDRRPPDPPAQMAHQSSLGQKRQPDQEQAAQNTKVPRRKRKRENHTVQSDRRVPSEELHKLIKHYSKVF